MSILGKSFRQPIAPEVAHPEETRLLIDSKRQLIDENFLNENHK